MNHVNPNNLKPGDEIYIEEAWEDEAGNFWDEYARVVSIDDDGSLNLDFFASEPAVKEFLATADFSAKDYEPLAPKAREEG